MRLTLAGASLLWVLSSLASPLPAQFSSEFDEYFKQATLDRLCGYFPECDWRYLKAQAIQESSLDPEAVSPVGASGLLQIMPETAPEVRLSWSDRFDAEKNIRAGSWYLRKRIRAWWPRPTKIDRLRLAWGAYNWGFGNMLDAQLACNGALLWEQIEACVVPKETRDYVRLIPKWYQQIAQ